MRASDSFSLSIDTDQFGASPVNEHFKKAIDPGANSNRALSGMAPPSILIHANSLLIDPVDWLGRFEIESPFSLLCLN